MLPVKKGKKAMVLSHFIYTVYIHYIAKSIGSPLMNRFDYFSNFYEYKS